MYCGKCNTYIPDLPNLTACLECGTPIEESRQLQDQIVKKKQAANQKQAKERLLGEKSYDYVDAVWRSFFSRHLYRDVLRRWSGMGLVYLAFICAIGTIPFLTGDQQDVSKKINEKLLPVVEKIPRIQASHGVIDFEGNGPVAIREPKGDQILVLLSKSEDAVDFSGIPALFCITPRQIFIKESAGTFRVWNLPDQLSFAVTTEMLLYWTRQFERWYAYLAYPFFWFAVWVGILCLTLFYALIGKGVAFILKIPADFQNIYRLTVIASTPSMLSSLIASPWIDFPDWIFFLSPIVFMILGLWYNRESQKKAVTS